jgi:hypothetical protein
MDQPQRPYLDSCFAYFANGAKASFRSVSSKNGLATLTISHSPVYKNQKIKLVVKEPSVIIIKEK